MKAMTIEQQLNACIRHANRNNDTIDGVEIFPHQSANHQVIMKLNGTGEYISVAVLMNRGHDRVVNESTWDRNRN